VIADRLARALPIVVHRFNASHSGMTRNEATFERPDLFAKDTWNKQVDDMRAVTRAARAGELPGIGAGRPVIAAGHSRGGVACLLSAGREGPAAEKPDAIITLASPSWCAADSAAKQKELAETGRLALTSARTGQELYQDAGWLEEQLADPAGHDLLALCERIAAPTLVVHGAEDETIPARCAREIGVAIPEAEVVVIGGCDHVFNTKHPADIETELSGELAKAVGAMQRLLWRVISDGGGRPAPGSG
jgi:pimeloyl-ACP methyl ester carboxylesterase